MLRLLHADDTPCIHPAQRAPLWAGQNLRDPQVFEVLTIPNVTMFPTPMCVVYVRIMHRAGTLLATEGRDLPNDVQHGNESDEAEAHDEHGELLGGRGSGNESRPAKRTLKWDAVRPPALREHAH